MIVTDVFTVKRRLRNYRREMSHKRLTHETEEMGLKTRSGRVVLTAIAMYVSYKATYYKKARPSLQYENS